MNVYIINHLIKPQIEEPKFFDRRSKSINPELNVEQELKRVCGVLAYNS
jgi:hypothetical protein